MCATVAFNRFLVVKLPSVDNPAEMIRCVAELIEALFAHRYHTLKVFKGERIILFSKASRARASTLRTVSIVSERFISERGISEGKRERLIMTYGLKVTENSGLMPCGVLFSSTMYSVAVRSNKTAMLLPENPSELVVKDCSL